MGVAKERGADVHRRVVEATKAGASVDALEALYEREYHRFLRVAEAITRDVETARDAVQDAFANAIRRRSTYRAAGSLEAWVWRSVLNAARLARRQARRAEPRAVAGGPASPQPAGGEAVREAIASLPERQRLAVFLRYYADLDYTTIAAALGIREGTVGAALHSAHRTLRHQLEEVGQ